MTPHRPEPKVKVGLIGCGTISDAYVRTVRTFPVLGLVACADRIPEAALSASRRWGVEAQPVEALLARGDLDIVLNLTVPQAHAEVTRAALEAGKHVHVEKPLALNRDEGRAVLDKAAELGLRVSCAPDTFLGAGLQTARFVLDSGAIGRVVAGTAFMMIPGHERWHPNPDFYYRRGGGPLFDMGPYYLTALVHLLGPVRRVSAAAAMSYPTRTIMSEPRRGEVIPVEVPTHVSGTLEFHSGALVTLVMSFDVHHHTHHPIELHGELGSLQVPDPNHFGGEVRVRAAGAEAWEPQEPVNAYTDNMRGIGAADLAHALLAGRPHRCHGELAFHVLDTMQSLHEAAERGTHVTIQSRCERPEPLPLGVGQGRLEAAVSATS
ncbi:Gfo/Idh/MocA family protein [Truepera radiovictrix]|uniref:Oxidoreductase domain protein n=1 Tax=Truepera radiovictrix (strain DSM 17093 / CIP 108686 / LMG 22925 / RQ-24) TaxID=649638 RepID=D7CRC1_TRURR|nr:Gfo/Idh/MocA family oxidoreductase [Truepera radiovictrix]ADI15209.1 oxidoreductase domain protein [Truepera radiovictrix DSM 17093]WMT56240.1 Gfo/Idh/MocA family oxidoreductase [Truepera radiovictrix]